METNNKLCYTKKDVYLTIFFLLFWILPLMYTGLTKQKVPFFPRVISYLYSTANLFTHATPTWPMPYIQAYFKDQNQWKTLPDAEYFKMNTFGYRTRFFEALYYAPNIPDYKQKQKNTYRQLAKWIATRHAELHPDQRQPNKIRFVAGLYHVNSKFVEEGHWKKIPLESFSPEDIKIIWTEDIP